MTISPIPLFKVFMADDAPARVAEVLQSGYIGQGPKVDAFEAALEREFVSDGPILTVNSCTAALDLALHLCDVGPGDYVLSTPMTCTATNGVIVRRGARIIWADVDPVTGLLSPESVKRRMWDAPRKPKAIMAVDWGGRACDYHALRQAAPNVPIIEDAAHAPLAQYHGRPIAYMGGDYVCWSFQAIKHLTTGDGGALKVPAEQVERARLLRWYGLDRTKGDSFRCSQDIAEVGYKYHLNDIAAAIGLTNLPHLADVVYRHRQNARLYHEAFAELPLASGVLPPPTDPGSSWWLYTLLVPERDTFIAHLASRGIAASPVHARNDRHPGFSGPSAEGALPGVDVFAAHEVAIPVGWWLSDQDRWRVIDAVREWAYASTSTVGDVPDLAAVGAV